MDSQETTQHVIKHYCFKFDVIVISLTITVYSPIRAYITMQTKHFLLLLVPLNVLLLFYLFFMFMVANITELHFRGYCM